jgi:hypothetical protein
MRYRTKQIVLILVTCVAIIGLISACNSLSGPVATQETGGGEAVPSVFQVSGLSIDPAEVVTGQGVLITADVMNSGETDGIYEAELRINNVSEVSFQMAIPARETQKLFFVASKDIPGTYEVVLDGHTGQFVVTEPVAAQYINALSVASGQTGSSCCGSAAPTKIATSGCGCSGATGSTNPSVPSTSGCGCGATSSTNPSVPSTSGCGCGATGSTNPSVPSTSGCGCGR